MGSPYGILVGPHDHNLYVSSGYVSNSGTSQITGVLRYNGTTGAFIDVFIDGGHLVQPRSIIFGPDGNLYVADRPGVGQGRVVRYDGRTGAFIDDFVPTGSNGPAGPGALVFGPSVENPRKLDLYVASWVTDSILRYDGTTGAFRGVYVASGSGGLTHGVGMSFGPDGNLYIAHLEKGVENRGVLRFQGPSGKTPGAPMPAPGNSGADFIAPGSGGLLSPTVALFGPDGNGDGSVDLYVASVDLTGTKGQNKTATVKRYDGKTGTFINTFVTRGSGGLDDPQLMIFTETDPVTLAFTDGRRFADASTASALIAETRRSAEVQPLLTQAIANWHTSRLSAIDLRIGDLSNDTLGMASGQIIWLETNAAAWARFVDQTPWDDIEFCLPDDQGEQNRMDLLTALEHELGHILARI